MRKGLAVVAILIALAVAVGIMLAAVPNVEGISAVCFFSGYLTGLKRGGVIGAVAIGLFSLLNPLGPAPPPILAAQMVGMAVVGMAGSVFCRLGGRWPGAELWAMGFGALLTLVYDCLTNYGVAVSIGRWNSPMPVVLSGIPFAAIHVATNTLIFGAVGTLVASKRWPRRSGSREAAGRAAGYARRPAAEDPRGRAEEFDSTCRRGGGAANQGG